MYELAPSFQLSRKTEYTGGKAGIAPFALNSTNHALTQFTHLCINYSNAYLITLRISCIDCESLEYSALARISFKL